MSAQPIFAAIDAGHWFRTVTVDEAKKHVGWKEGELRCRGCNHMSPCPAILQARREAGPVQSMVKTERPFAGVPGR